MWKAIVVFAVAICCLSQLGAVGFGPGSILQLQFDNGYEAKLHLQDLRLVHAQFSYLGSVVNCKGMFFHELDEEQNAFQFGIFFAFNGFPIASTECIMNGMNFDFASSDAEALIQGQSVKVTVSTFKFGKLLGKVFVKK